MIVTTDTHLSAVEMRGCGHITWLTDDRIQELRRTHKSFYCSTCGRTNYYPGKSDIEKLKGKLRATRDMLDTVRQDRDLTKRTLTAHKAAKTRLKNRIAAGVCPCCKRSFKDLHRHMQNKHPGFAE